MGAWRQKKIQGARGNYKGKAENFDSNYIKRFQTNHVIGHVSIERIRWLNIDGIPQPPTKMPKVKCPVCIASKPQHQHMTQDQHQDLGKISIRISQAKCAYHP